MNFRRFLLISAFALITPMSMASPSSTSSTSRPSSSPSPSFSRPSSPAPSFSRPNIHEDSPAPTFSRPTVTRDTTNPTFSRPSSPTAPPPSATAGASSPSFSRPGAPLTATANRSAAPPSSVLDRAVTGSASKNSLAAFDSEQNKYKAPPVAAPASTSSARSSYVYTQYGARANWNSSDDYWAARRRAELRHPYVVPQYVQQGPPSYGGYAAAFLGGMLLQNIMQPSYANWAYSHQNDPDVQRWHTDMQQRASDDPELKAKLAQYDAQIAALQAQNAPKTDRLPDDVDPSEVVAPQVAMLATAKPGHPILYAIMLVGVGILICIGGVAGLVFWSQRRNRSIA